MKIAVPTRGNVVDDHFGHCEAFTVFTIDENKKISNSEIMPSVQGCGCKSNIAGILAQSGVTIMLAGGIGGGAVNVLNNAGIAVVRGCSGNVTELVNQYVEGLVLDSGSSCQHHEHHDEGHQCSH